MIDYNDELSITAVFEREIELPAGKFDPIWSHDGEVVGETGLCQRG